LVFKYWHIASPHRSANHAVPYFFISQTYDTTEAKRLLRSHNIACPRFKSYVEPLLDFVDDNPML
jgi:hypothetical protein